MPTSSNRIVDFVSVGKPSKQMQNSAETVQIVIHDFENRKEPCGEYIRSPNFRALGYEWCIDFYPRGESFSTYIACYVKLRDSDVESVTVGYSFCCKGRELLIETKRKFENGVGWGFDDLLERQDALENYLDEDGSLSLTMEFRRAGAKHVWCPEKFQQNSFLVKLYQDSSSENFDAVFSLGDNLYKAHKVVLALRWMKLYEIVNDINGDASVPIEIPSMRGETFKQLLEWVHTVKLPETANDDDAKELITAADRFELIGLKLFLEFALVKNILNTENAVSWLIFADSHSCALLKEQAMKIITENRKAIQKLDSWSQIQESAKLLEELLESATPSKPTGEEGDVEAELDRMDVAGLRGELEVAKLPLDGSRTVLVNRLKEHRQGQASKS